jgi:phosphoribosylglycinamide formyltransferase-1
MSETGKLRIAVLISGSGTNLQAIIDAHASGAIAADIVGVISDKPEAYGLTRAADADIPAIAVDYKAYADKNAFNQALLTKLSELRPELVVLAGYMRILPDEIVNAYSGRMLNVHPSLLPAYPGLDTYNRAIAAGEQWHGTTVHFVIPELDAGTPVLQYRVAIKTDDTEPALRERVQRGEYIIYPEAIAWFAQGRLRYADGGAYLDDKHLDTPIVMEATP